MTGLLASGEVCCESGDRKVSLIDKVSAKGTLQLAWEKVRANAGAGGVDGITIGRFAQNSQSRLLAVNEHLNKGTYQPKPVKRVWIEKPGSADKRPLGIPTVTDGAGARAHCRRTGPGAC